MRVHTPVKGFNGTVAGVEFVDGVGESADPAAIAYFQRAGYEIEAGEAKPAEPQPEPEPEMVEAPAERPSQTDRKADWVEYAVATGFAASEAEADEYTKSELIELTQE